MLKIERYAQIENLLSRKEAIGISEICSRLHVSRATIYRDIKDMASSGNVRLVRGGIAKPNVHTSLVEESAHSEKIHTNTEEKMRLAEAAVQKVRPGSAVFLDSSTTVFHMCRHLKKFDSLFLITNDLKIAGEFTTSPNITVYVLGGKLRHNYYTLSDHSFENDLRDISIDTAFLSCDAFDIPHGCMITNEDEVPLKKYIINRAASAYLLCDHSKYDHSAFISFSDARRFANILTGKELSEELRQKYIDSFPKLVIL